MFVVPSSKPEHNDLLWSVHSVMETAKSQSVCLFLVSLTHKPTQTNPHTHTHTHIHTHTHTPLSRPQLLSISFPFSQSLSLPPPLSPTISNQTYWGAAFLGIENLSQQDAGADGQTQQDQQEAHPEPTKRDSAVSVVLWGAAERVKVGQALVDIF